MKKKLSELALQFPVLEEKQMKSLNGGSDNSPGLPYTDPDNGLVNAALAPRSTPSACPPGMYEVSIPGFMNRPGLGYCVPY